MLLSSGRSKAQLITGGMCRPQEALQEAVGDAGFEAALLCQEELASSDRAVLRVEGMTCASCSSAVESALRAVEGVHYAAVDLIGGKAEVRLVCRF